MDNSGWAAKEEEEEEDDLDDDYFLREEDEAPLRPLPVKRSTIEEILEKIICKQDQLTFFKHFKEKERKRWW